MDVLYPRCAGLDVHKDTVVAAVRIAANGAATIEVRTFDTTTPGLLALSGWLAECGCTHVAMEATGVYWKPVWHILSDGDVTLILANAAHVKNVPGRKTDVADAAWLADLLAHGLVRASFVPEAPTQAMRALLRTRKQLVREQASHAQRIQKTLEDANLKLGSVLTQVMGKSGRAIIGALIAGERDPDALLRLVQRGVKASPEKLRAALTGSYVGERRASDTNILLNRRPYALPGYVLMEATLSTSEFALGRGHERTVSFALIGKNLLGSRGPSPGFSGLDYPLPPRALLVQTNLAL